MKCKSSSRKPTAFPQVNFTPLLPEGTVLKDEATKKIIPTPATPIMIINTAENLDLSIFSPPSCRNQDKQNT
jgi:hypothetical protein